MEARIHTVYDKHKSRYDYRRIATTLRSSMARPVSHKGVQRLMPRMGLRSLIRATKRNRCVTGASDVNVPNVLQRQPLPLDRGEAAAWDRAAKLAVFGMLCAV